MRSFLLGTAVLVASASLAIAADDVMANYYGNTVVSKSDMGESHVMYSADHSFSGSASGAMGSMGLKGTWKIDDKGQLCRTYDTPPPGMPNPLCTDWASHNVGDSWTMMGRTITLMQGKQ